MLRRVRVRIMQTLRACTTGCDLAVEIYTQRVDGELLSLFASLVLIHTVSLYAGQLSTERYIVDSPLV